MRKQLHLYIVETIFALTILIFGIHQVEAQTVDPNAVDGNLHIKLSTDPGFVLDGYTSGNLALDLLFGTSGLDSIYKPFSVPGTALDSVYRVVFPNATQVNALIPVLEALPYVEYAEKNPMAFEFNTPNDLHSNQWSLEKIEAELGWNHSTGSSSVLIAVLDDAIAIDHQDLAANIYTNSAESGGLPFLDDDANGRADDINGYDVADNDADPRPPSGASGNNDGFAHGTHVAGIAGAVTNNGTGMASIGYSITILPVKIGKNSNGSLSGGLDGVFYAMRSGADVISMSWGTNSDALTFRTLIQQASSSGIVMVAAAGNEGDQTIHYPAAYPEVIGVGATDQNDQKASFSNFGNTVDVMAPGVGIYSTLPEANNTYGNLSGTSMATPMVAGLAGLVLSQSPGLNPTQVKQRIQQGCDDISAQNPGFSGQIGSGRINAFKTLGNVSIGDVEASGLSIYPNPATDVVYFSKTENDEVSRITISDLSGRVIVSTGWTETLDVSKLTSGVYSVAIDVNSSISYSKMVVQ